jgi:hypothetical protein
MQVGFEFLPDETRTYAIDTSTYFGTHNFTTELYANGLLKQVDWNPDSTVIASEVISAAAAIGKETLSAREAEKEARDKARTEAEGAAQQDVTTARAAVDSAQSTLDKLESDLRVLEFGRAQLGPVTTENEAQVRALDLQIFQKNEEIRLASDALARVQAELREAEEKLALLQGRSLQSELEGSDAQESDVPADTSSSVAATPEQSREFDRAWGGVLFAVNEVRDPDQTDQALVVLEPLPTDGLPQVSFETTSVPKEPTKSSKPKVTLTAGGVLTLPAFRDEVRELQNLVELVDKLLEYAKEVKDAGMIRKYELQKIEVDTNFEQALRAAEASPMTITLTSNPAPKSYGEATLMKGEAVVPLQAIRRNAATLDLRVPNSTEEGVYKLEVTIEVQAKGGTEPLDYEFTIEIR